MSNGIFIRPYPARGAQVVPTSFSAGLGGYFLICLVPVWALLFFLTPLYLGLRRPWLSEGLVASALALLIALSFARRLRLEIGTNGISYTSLFGAARFVAFSEISTVIFIDHRNIRSEAYPRRTPFSWTAIVTPNLETGKSVMRIPLSLFPGAAYLEMKRVLGPEVWESGS